MFAHLSIYLVWSILIVSVSGETFRRRISPEQVKVSDSTEVYKHVMSIVKTPDVNCPPGKLRDRFGKCRAVFKRSVRDVSLCQEKDENGNCRELTEGVKESCADRAECGGTVKCDGGPCAAEGEAMQRTREEITGNRDEPKSGRNFVFILRKKKKLIEPFLKTKPHPPLHHSSESEGVKEEKSEPDEGSQDLPGVGTFNDGICVENEGGTTGNCIGSSQIPEISEQNAKSTKRVQTKVASSLDIKVAGLLKVLRMRRRLNPALGQSLRGDIKENTRIPGSYDVQR